MWKTYKAKLTFWVISIDLLLYWLVFRSGITLPLINPSVEDYQPQLTSFPRNANQMYAWIFAHLPMSLIGRLGDQWLIASVAQTGLIFYVLGALMDQRRQRQMKRTGPAGA